MNPLANPNIIRHVMQKNGLQFNKRYGQNFLTDETVLETIAECAGASDHPVLEIGPGLGTLTWELVRRSERVFSVEIDKGLAELLPSTLSDFSNLTVLCGDILDLNLQELVSREFCGRSPVVAANLPYYITTPIIMHLLESGIPFPNLVIMIQKEVAERIAASPGSKQYGVLTVAVNYYAESQTVCTVPADVFLPAPNVDSAVLSLRPRPYPGCTPVSEKAFFRVVKAAFAQRRKTLLNSFCGAGCFRGTKEEITDVIENAGISPNVRGETLSIEQFCNLANDFCKNQLI